MCTFPVKNFSHSDILAQNFNECVLFLNFNIWIIADLIVKISWNSEDNFLTKLSFLHCVPTEISFRIFFFHFQSKRFPFVEKNFSEKGEGSLESATNRCALHGCYSNWFRRRNGERVLSYNRHILLPWASQMGNLSSSTPPSLAQLLMEFQISGNVLKHFPSSCHCRFNDISDCFELTKYFRSESTWRLMDIHMISLHPSNEYSLNYLMCFN